MIYVSLGHACDDLRVLAPLPIPGLAPVIGIHGKPGFYLQLDYKQAEELADRILTLIRAKEIVA